MKRTDERETARLGINKSRSLTEEENKLLLEELEERKDGYAFKEGLEECYRLHDSNPKFNRECIVQPRKAVTRQKRKEIFDIVKDLNMEDEENNRVSRISSRTTVRIEEKYNEPELTFLEKLNNMFGCITRRIPAENKNLLNNNKSKNKTKSKRIIAELAGEKKR